jgi:hypothetical protein
LPARLLAAWALAGLTGLLPALLLAWALTGLLSTLLTALLSTLTKPVLAFTRLIAS